MIILIYIVTSISFNPYIKNIFISGSMNKYNNSIHTSRIEKQIENKNSEDNNVNSYLKDMKVSKIKKKKKYKKMIKKKMIILLMIYGEPLKEALDYFNLEHKVIYHIFLILHWGWN